MTKFNSEHYEFMTFDPLSLDHQKAKMYLVTDLDVRKYLAWIDEDIKRNSKNKITDNSYLVIRNGKVVGYLSLFDYDNFIDMQYAVIASSRGFKYSLCETTGASIVREASEEVFKIAKKVDFIRLYIDENNIKSIRAAINAGFKYSGQVDDELETGIYTKHRK